MKNTNIKFLFEISQKTYREFFDYFFLYLSQISVNKICRVLRIFFENATASRQALSAFTTVVFSNKKNEKKIYFFFFNSNVHFVNKKSLQLEAENTGGKGKSGPKGGIPSRDTNDTQYC